MYLQLFLTIKKDKYIDVSTSISVATPGHDVFYFSVYDLASAVERGSTTWTTAFVIPDTVPNVINDLLRTS